MKRLIGTMLILWSFNCALAKHRTDSVTLIIHGLNLSEDMSTLSSRNDEILLLIYDYSDSSKVQAPTTLEYFVLDSANRKKSVRIGCNSYSKSLILLVELDTERKPQQVETIIRKNMNNVLQLAKQNNRMELQKILGDDDILGYRILQTLCTKQAFTISGRFKLDKYSYGFAFTPD